MLPLSLVSPSVIVEDLTRMMMSYDHHKLKASFPFIKGCCKLVYVKIVHLDKSSLKKKYQV